MQVEQTLLARDSLQVKRGGCWWLGIRHAGKEMVHPRGCGWAPAVSAMLVAADI